MEGVTVMDAQVSYSKTEWLPDGGPRGTVSMGLTVKVELAEGVTLGSVHDKLQAGLQADVDKAMAAKIASMSPSSRPAPAAKPAQAPAAPAQAPAQPAAQAQPAGQPQAQSNGDKATEVWAVTTARHEVTPGGVHVLRFKGGRWQKHGAPMWPEVAKAIFGEGWLEAQPFGQDIPLPNGITQAVVELKADGKPDRVTRLE